MIFVRTRLRTLRSDIGRPSFHGQERSSPARAGAAVLCVLIPALAATGCQAPPQPTGPTAMVLDLADYDGFVDSAMTILRERHFGIDRGDRRAGVIVSHPATGAQWYEFWREDSLGPYQLLESSLHTLRRIVTVTIEPGDADAREASSKPATARTRTEKDDESRHEQDALTPDKGPGRYRITVRVDKERYSSPQRQVTTASGALAIFSERVPTRDGLRNARAAGAHWVPLGRDGLLEAALLAKFAGAPGVDPTE